MLNWTGLRDFLAVADTGSLSSAARKLKISQPTLGRRIQAIEEELGTELFVRTTQGLDLTRSGEMILHHARHMENDAYSIERLLTGNEQGLKGAVTVSVIESMSNMWLVQEFREFYKQYPEITVTLRAEQAAADLLRREADIAVRLFEPQQLDLIAKKAGTIRLALYASQEYVEQFGAPEKPEDLKDHRIVGPNFEELSMIQKRWEQLELPQGDVVFRSNNLTAILNALICGFGIGVHSCISCNRQPNLVRILPDINFMDLDFWLVTHADLKRNARIRATFDFLSDFFQRQRKTLLGLEK